MSDTAEQVETHEHKWEIVVDTVEHTVHSATVTWGQVVEIAYPGQSENPQYVFKVHYADAKGHPTSGPIVKGGEVEVERRGTTFSVVRSLVS